MLEGESIALCKHTSQQFLQLVFEHALDRPLYDAQAERKFLLLCQSRMGGIAKFPGDYPGKGESIVMPRLADVGN